MEEPWLKLLRSLLYAAIAVTYLAKAFLGAR